MSGRVSFVISWTLSRDSALKGKCLNLNFLGADFKNNQTTQQLNNYIWTNKKEIKFCVCLPIGPNRIVYFFSCLIVFKIRSLKFYISIFTCSNFNWQLFVQTVYVKKSLSLYIFPPSWRSNTHITGRTPISIWCVIRAVDNVWSYRYKY